MSAFSRAAWRFDFALLFIASGQRSTLSRTVINYKYHPGERDITFDGDAGFTTIDAERGEVGVVARGASS